MAWSHLRGDKFNKFCMAAYSLCSRWGNKSDVEGEAQLGLCDSNDSQLKSPAFSSAI